MSRAWCAVMACPQCRDELAVTDEVRCRRCGRMFRLVGERFIDFGANHGDEAAAIASSSA